MENKIKRFLTLALALLMVFSMMPQITLDAQAADFTVGTTLYLHTNSDWRSESARMAAYFFNSSSNTWEDMTDNDADGIYQVVVPEGNWANVIFCRMSPATTENDWDNKWTQTGDLTFDGNYFTITGWKTGTWSNNTPAAPTYYLAGVESLTGDAWKTDTDQMTSNDDGTYSITFEDVAAGTHEFKIAVNGSWDVSWGDTTTSNGNASVTTEATSNVTITFTPATKAITTEVVCVAHASHDTDGTCTTCGTTVEHSWNEGDVTTNPTCTDAGVKTYTCAICSGTKTEDIAATGHTYESVVTAPTCTEGGYTTYTSACGYTYTGDETVATGNHTYGENGICTTEGCGAEKTYVAQIDETKYETLAEAAAAAVAGDEIKIITAGTYAMNGISGKDITVTGAVAGVVFDNIGAHNMGGADVTFNNVTFDYLPNTNYTGLQAAGNLVYNGCTFNGTVFLYGSSETFNSCTFNVEGDAYNVWTYGAKKVAFNNCTFNSTGKSVLVYNEGACATDLTVTDCDFIASASFEGKAAIEIDTSLMPEGTEIVVDADTTATGFDEGSKSGSTLWNDKKVDTENTNGGGTSSTVTVAGVVVKEAVRIATGTVTPAYVSAEGKIWGEATSNSIESFVVELYEGETKIASASLNNIGGIINGDVYVTWNIPFADSTDKYWEVEWAEGYPKYDMNPDTVKLVVDGTEVATNNVQFNAPDNLNKIVALAEGYTGGVQAYTSLVEAMGSFNGRQVNVLCDVSEAIEEMSGVTLTTNVEGGVTIINTNDDYIYTMDSTIGKGITVVTSGMFFQGGENTILGRLEVDNDQFNSGAVYYQGYDAIVNVKDGGSVDVEGSVIFRYNENEGALNIYGDDDDSTVEFSCDYYIGAYSGTFYAEDANIETGYFLLKNSYDDSSYADVTMTLNNSTVTVVGTTDGQDSFIIDDQASLTLTNGATIEDVSNFQILADTDLALSIDNTSSISATNVSIADDVPLSAEIDDNGIVTFSRRLLGTGTEEDPYLINNLEDLKCFRDHVNTFAQDGSSQYTGKYIKLTADINLDEDGDGIGEEWEPIGSTTADHGSFYGIFDGDGHTIYNLVVSEHGTGSGFFAKTSGGGDGPQAVVKNITFENVDVDAGNNASYAGGVIANAGGNTVVSNVHVTGYVYVNGYGYVGGIVGHCYPDMDNCSVNAEEGSYVHANYWCAGGIIGYAGEGGTTITNCSVSGLDIWSAYGAAAAVAGLLQDGNTLTNVSASNVEVTSNSDYVMGYIAGNGEASTLTNVTIENVTATANGKEITSTDAVAQIGDAIYFDLQSAIDAAEAGATVTLLRDITITSYVKVSEGQNVVLDLNGKVIDGTENCNIAVMSYGDLTVKDSSTEQTGAIKAGKTSGKSGNAVNICAGTFTLESGSIYSVNNAILVDEQAAVINIKGGTITAEPTTSNSAALYISSKAETVVNIEGGTIVGYNGILLWNNTTVNMTGGSIDAKGSVAIQGNGNNDNTEINISGDASVTGYYAAIYHPQAGDLNISGNATLTGWTGVVVKGGNVNISGGTISGTGAANNYEPVSSGFIDTGDGLYIEHYDESTNSENYGTPTVVITGGTFNSTNAKAVASYANGNNGVDALDDFIFGGVYSSDVSDLCHPDFNAVATTVDGKTVYTVESKIVLTTTNMTLADSFSLNFWVNADQLRDDVDYIAKLTSGNKEPVYVTVTECEKTTWEDITYYVVEYKGLAAKEMTDEVSMQLFVGDDAVSNVFTESLRSNAEYLIQSGNSAELKTAMVDMLNYGAAAQKEFGYKTDDLANKNIDTYQSLATPNATAEDKWSNKDGIGYGSNLELKNNIILHIWFKNVGATSAKISYTDHYGNSKSTVVEAENFVDRMNGMVYSVPVTGLAVADGRQVVKVEFYNGETLVGTVTESVESYIAYMMSKTSGNELYEMTMKFVTSAYNLFH